MLVIMITPLGTKKSVNPFSEMYMVMVVADISNEQKKPRKASVICEHHLKIIR